MSPDSHASAPAVLRCRDCDTATLQRLVERYGLRLRQVGDDQPIPGSYWGDEEAGLVGSDLLVRADTPLHSLLHEACHYVCMDPQRRAGLDTDAGGGYDEENAVCYLSILLAGEIPGFGRERMLRDMDAWGYSFRLGSAAAWFDSDAEDALAWLRREGLVTRGGRATFATRGSGVYERR